MLAIAGRSPSVPPRFSHPYGGYHMNRNSVAGGYFFSPFATPLGAPNIFSCAKRQFVGLAKFVQSVLRISFARHILQVFDRVVVLVAIFMVYITSWRAVTEERSSNHRMNCFVRMFSVHRQRDEQVPIASASGDQNTIFSRFVRRASKNLAYNRLAYAYHRRNFSRALPLLAQFVNQRYLFFGKCSLRQILRSKASYFPDNADFVGIFKTIHTGAQVSI